MALWGKAKRQPVKRPNARSCAARSFFGVKIAYCVSAASQEVASVARHRHRRCASRRAPKGAAEAPYSTSLLPANEPITFRPPAIDAPALATFHRTGQRAEWPAAYG